MKYVRLPTGTLLDLDRIVAIYFTGDGSEYLAVVLDGCVDPILFSEKGEDADDYTLLCAWVQSCPPLHPMKSEKWS